MRTRNGFAHIEVLVVILLVAVVGIVVFMFGGNNSSREEISSPIPTSSSEAMMEDEMSDWEIYTNTEYGFTFKYPQDWYSNDCNLSSTLLLNPIGVPVCETEPTDPIILSVDSRITQENYESVWSGSYSVTQESISLPLKAKQYLLIETSPSPGPEKLREIVIPIPESSILVKFTIFDESELNTSHQILSTFEFTNQPIDLRL